MGCIIKADWRYPHSLVIKVGNIVTNSADFTSRTALGSYAHYLFYSMQSKTRDQPVNTSLIEKASVWPISRVFVLQGEELDNLAAMDAELQQIAEKMHDNWDGWAGDGGGDEDHLMWATADVSYSSVCACIILFM